MTVEKNITYLSSLRYPKLLFFKSVLILSCHVLFKQVLAFVTSITMNLDEKETASSKVGHLAQTKTQNDTKQTQCTIIYEQ